MSDNDDRQEAQEQLRSRIGEMRTFLDFDGDPYDDGPEELGSIYDYGLEWTKEATNHRYDLVTYVHVLSTGGPHEEFNVTFNKDGEVTRVVFVSLPWFGRVEHNLFTCPSEVASLEEAETVKEFYERFYGDLVTMEMEQ